MRSKEDIKEYHKEYYSRPEVKERVRVYMKKYRNRPENKARKNELSKKYREKSEYKKYMRDYSKRTYVRKKKRHYERKPEIKDKKKKYLQKTETKKIIAEYRNRPYVIRKRKDYSQIPEVKKKINNRCKIRRMENSKIAIIERLRARVRSALNSYTKTGKIKSACKYGINYKAIIEHLKPFPKDRHLYHIDHIKPLVLFDLENSEEIKKAFAPENHQWLLIDDHLKKGIQYPYVVESKQSILMEVKA